ncbi:MAG TPA: hypothetical protein VGJ03_01040 [Acidimicrobiales bacterium]|jgi:hypothetical protein
MAAPEYVPVKPMDDVRTYESPPRRPDSWIPRRPGDLKTGQPRGSHFGNPGPDQGYGLVLAHNLRPQLHVQLGESLDDVIHGSLPVALKRASMMGRAPVIHDLVIAFTLWGYLDDHPEAELIATRKPLFAEVAHPAHSVERQHIAAIVPDSTLRMKPEDVKTQYASNWRSLLELDGA